MRPHSTLFLAALMAALSIPALAATFTDQRGKELSFDKPVSRVVTIAIPQLWIYMAVDGGPGRIVGANPTAMNQMKPSLLAKIYPEALAIPTNIVAGGTFTPNVEELLKLKPDVVFQWADRGDDLIKALEQAKLTTVGVKNTGSETDFVQWVSMMSETDGHQDRVKQILADRQAMVDRLNTAIGALPDSQKPHVLSLQQYSKQLVADGGNSYPDIYIRRAGGINVAGDVKGAAGNASITMEQVLAWKPEVIFLSQFEDKTPADLEADPVWRTLPAVQNKRVYKLPFGGSRWGGADQETPMFWIWMAQLQHPGLFKVKLVDEMKRQYRFLYNSTCFRWVRRKRAAWG